MFLDMYSRSLDNIHYHKNRSRFYHIHQSRSPRNLCIYSHRFDDSYCYNRYHIPLVQSSLLHE